MHLCALIDWVGNLQSWNLPAVEKGQILISANAPELLSVRIS